MTVQMNTGQFGAAAQALARATGAPVIAVIRSEVPLILKRVSQFTPPFGAGSRPTIGKNAIRNDIYNTARPADSRSVTIPSLKKAIERRNLTAVQAIVDNLPQGHSWRRRQVVTGNLEALHKADQNSRGRVRKDQRRLYVPAKDHRKYLRQVQSRVGYTLGGYTLAAQRTGAVLPKFATKFGVKGSTYVEYPTNTRPYLIFGNFRNKIPGYEKTVEAAVNSRAKTMQLKLSRFVSGRAVNLGFTVR
jgi:hypothetical protein